MKKVKRVLPLLFIALACALLPHGSAASATSLPLSNSTPYGARINDAACTGQPFQGSVPLLGTLKISNIPSACIGKQIVVYTFGTSLSSTPAYTGTITGSSVSIPISNLLSLSILGVNAFVDGWGAKVTWLGGLI